jgi:hypothetical protein
MPVIKECFIVRQAEAVSLDYAKALRKADMKYIAFVILLGLSCQVAAEVYKCTAGEKTVYQQAPCSEGGEELTIKTAPSSATAAPDPIPGLRDSEKELLERLQTKPEKPAKKPKPQPADLTSATRSCLGVRVLGFQPYTTTLIDDDGYTDINQCARVTLKLEIYSGRLRSSVAHELKPRFYARFFDGAVSPVYSIELQGPDRASPIDNQFSARICFGVSDYDIEQVGCR